MKWNWNQPNLKLLKAFFFVCKNRIADQSHAFLIFRLAEKAVFNFPLFRHLGRHRRMLTWIQKNENICSLIMNDIILYVLIMSHALFRVNLYSLVDWIPRQVRYLKFKGCVRYIFASVSCISKREHLWNKETIFLFHFESSFRSWDNQILTFQIFKCHDVIKCPSVKYETHFTE